MRLPDQRNHTGSTRHALRRLIEAVSAPRQHGRDVKRGRLLLETLERRQLLAGDVELLATDGSDDNPPAPAPPAQLVVTGQAEGEAAPDLVQFALDLDAAGVKFYGANWCPACTQQKQLFADGGDDLPFIEVTGPDRTLNQIGINENITLFPTWEFPDGTRAEGVLDLATLSSRANVAIPQSEDPTFVTVGSQTVANGSPLHIPIDAYDPNGGPLTVTVSVADPALLEATVLSGNRSLRLDMQGFGDMVFELFEQRAPVPAGRVATLAQAGFYDGIIFHRVVDNFVIQAGDPTGTGTSGSTLGNFDDQFHPDLQHNGSGVLSFAKTSDDTNNSQFFVTETPTRHLDFNHSIFGQLVEGEDVREAISNMETNDSGTPTTPITISTASVFTDTENSVIMLKGLGGTGTTNVTITVTDSDGNTHSEVVQVTVVNDTVNGQPYLDPITTPGTTAPDTAAQLQLSSVDVEGDAVTYLASLQTQGSVATVDVNATTGLVTVTPASGFTGDVEVLVGVQAAVGADDFDSQLVTFSFESEQGLAAPSSLDLLATSDTGSSSSDNITRAGSLSFRITGVTTGATVEIVNTATGTVVGAATASGSTVTVTTNNIAALGDGTYVLAARQRLSGITSGLSPALSVTYDATNPTSVVSSAAVFANIGRAFTTDLVSPEEGSGLVYQLSSGPSGTTIDATTGVIQWTPTQNQSGDNLFTLSLTDVAGNVRSESFTVAVADEPLLGVRLEITDLQGNPINSLGVGDEFLLRMYGQDLRSTFQQRGVFAAFADVLFDGTLARPVPGSSIEFDSEFALVRTGSVSTGLINELGAATSNSVPSDEAESLIATIRLEALAAGSVNFRSEPADAASSESLLYLIDDEIPDSQVEYGSVALAIGQNFTVSDDTITVAEDSGGTVIDVLDNDQVVSGTGTLTVVSVTQPTSGGTASLTSGEVVFTPEADFFGTAEFTYRVSDTNGVQSDATVTVTVTNVNDEPTGTADSFDVTENAGPTTLDVLANDFSDPDPSDETLTVTEVSTSSNGATITIASGGGSINYTPATGFTGVDTFTYRVSDGTLSSQVQVSVTVLPADPPPTANDDAFTVTEDDVEAEFDVLDNDLADASNEAFLLDDVGTPSQGGNVRISGDGTQFFYKPAPNFAGSEEVTYTIRDAGGGLAVATVTFTVTGVNDPPPIENEVIPITRGSDEREVLLIGDLPDNVDAGETLTFGSTVTTSAGGTARVENGSRIFYTPPSATFVGQDTINYTVNDSSGASSSGTLIIEVVEFAVRSLRLDTSVTHVSYFASSSVKLSGTDVLGASVARDFQLGGDGPVVEDLLPGTYTITIPAVPFLQNGEQPREIVVTSAADDGDMTIDPQLGRLRPEYLSLRDWLGSTPRNAILTAISPGGSSLFAIPTSTVDFIADPIVALDAAETELTIHATDKEPATIPLNGTRRVETRGEANGVKLLRIAVQENDFTNATASTAAAGTAADSGGEGESVAASPLVADGVGEGETTDASLQPTTRLSIGETQPEGESPAAAAVSRNDVFVPSMRTGGGRVDATVLPLESGDVWLGTTPKATAGDSNPAEESGSAADRVMPDVAEALMIYSAAADELAEREAREGGLAGEAVDLVIANPLG